MTKSPRTRRTPRNETKIRPRPKPLLSSPQFEPRVIKRLVQQRRYIPRAFLPPLLRTLRGLFRLSVVAQALGAVALVLLVIKQRGNDVRLLIRTILLGLSHHHHNRVLQGPIMNLIIIVVTVATVTSTILRGSCRCSHPKATTTTTTILTMLLLLALEEEEHFHPHSTLHLPRPCRLICHNHRILPHHPIRTFIIIIRFHRPLPGNNHCPVEAKLLQQQEQHQDEGKALNRRNSNNDSITLIRTHCRLFGRWTTMNHFIKNKATAADHLRLKIQLLQILSR
mmetsp:Transcript_8518/g.23564  ORF Transcript_8518/g.23564 Transcript_8518/m.23564 type:complete len:281 (+) Transcript_8518:853-1695(+)